MRHCHPTLYVATLAAAAIAACAEPITSPHLPRPGGAARTITATSSVSNTGISYAKIGDRFSVHSVSDGGFVVGSIFAGPETAWSWKDGVRTQLSGLAGTLAIADVEDVNVSGQAVGSSSSASGVHATLWSGGTATDLGAFGNGSEAWAINDGGEVVGDAYKDGRRIAWVWQNGAMTVLPDLGGPETIAYDVNRNGWIAGSSRT